MVTDPFPRRRTALHPPDSLIRHFRPDDLSVFTKEEAARFLAGIDPEALCRLHDDPDAWGEVGQAVAWELLYRLEPELYERLTAGENLHPAILDWLPDRIRTAVEVGAGAGRLTIRLAPRCRELVAVEPASPLAARLESNLARMGLSSVRVVKGFFDSIPLPDDWAELVIACSAFTTEPAHGGESGLAEMERVCADEGVIVIVWPGDTGWMTEHGFETLTFPGDLAHKFQSLEEAVEMAYLFYPEAVPEILRRGAEEVPYEVLGIPAPRTLSWKKKRAGSQTGSTNPVPGGGSSRSRLSV